MKRGAQLFLPLFAGPTNDSKSWRRLREGRLHHPDARRVSGRGVAAQAGGVSRKALQRYMPG